VREKICADGEVLTSIMLTSRLRPDHNQFIELKL
jgi:hypothetical protein